MPIRLIMLQIALCATFPVLCAADDLKVFLLDASRYDPTSRPITPGTNLTNIHTTIAILDMLGMDDIKQTASILAILTVTWRDELLTWNPTDYNGTTHLHLTPESIWVPDALSHAFEGDNIANHTKACITSAGIVTLVTRRTLQSSCDDNVNGFWSTKHLCYFVFTSGYRAFEQCSLDGTSVTTQFSRTHSSWTVSPVTFSKVFTADLDYLLFQFSMERTKWPTLWYPVTATVILTLVPFFLPPPSGRKITLSCVNLFIMTALLLDLDYYFEGQTAVPQVVSFLSHSIALVTASLVVSAIVLRIARGDQGYPAPRPLLNLLEGILGRLLCVSVGSSRHDPDMKRLTDNIPPLRKHEARRQREWFAVAQAVDRIFFFIFAIGFMAVRVCS